jgi:hypothetical protein
MIHRAIRLLLLAALLSGCATATQGPLQRIYVDSDPADAEIDARRCGVSLGSTRTPATILVSRRATRCEIVLRRVGYSPAVVTLNRRVSGAIGGNLNALDIACGDCPVAQAWTVALLGALTGFTVDAVSGAMYELQPARIFFDFEEEQWWNEESTLDEPEE